MMNQSLFNTLEKSRKTVCITMITILKGNKIIDIRCVKVENIGKPC